MMKAPDRDLISTRITPHERAHHSCQDCRLRKRGFERVATLFYTKNTTQGFSKGYRSSNQCFTGGCTSCS
ncbi:hypothetical protein Y1Q_0009702 [Alligator mississippiensis]|uniref:Uncharacterized protein n=1 Tax=Alligator mississippiensis TaxID=8496 RepID=A0A151MWG3_ALLMI|nr:hypothetical protein Y1Q_0009702 [Alligator mississippiensis]